MTRSRRCAALLVLFILLLLTPATADAYVGPGAGIAFLSSFLVLFTSGLLAVFSLVAWPFRVAWRLIRHARRPKAKIQRLIVLGLDGQDPNLTDRFMREGKLPNFQRLAEQGCYHRLLTTFPSVSPVAWSSFSTGTHPARHNIFDFLDRDRRTYLPMLSSTRIGKVERSLKLGRLQIPLRRPEIRLLRKSKPFWSILGEYNIWSTILRVPITFPPDKFYGAQLSAMSVPDLLGTQGTFLLYTTREAQSAFKEGGKRIVLERGDTTIKTHVEGPENSFAKDKHPLRTPFVIELDSSAQSARVKANGKTIVLSAGKLSDWIELSFAAAPGINVRGITRMMITEMGEHFSLYMSPINIDPEQPAMPISHPSFYSIYLAKLLGKYSTLGLAEDTWALNEGVIDDGTFLKQTYDIDREREGMFFAALDKLRRGALVCVFDATDRIQHMFWRYIDSGHPAGSDAASAEHRDAIERLYVHNDALVGRAMSRLRDGDLFMVLSDHGFSSFRRGVNLNSWLHANGYLVLREGRDGAGEWLSDVDWSRTRAYAVGLTGLFLNMKGREEQGIVAPGDEANAFKAELIGKLTGLLDAARGAVGIREAFDTALLYAGPYLENAPDLLIGYNAGYRASWDGATGVVARPVFEDNVKPWSGDHCIDPRLVPGVFFCNRAIDRDDPALIDIAPTALQQFGVTPPPHMDGKPLFRETGATAA